MRQLLRSRKTKAGPKTPNRRRRLFKARKRPLIRKRMWRGKRPGLCWSLSVLADRHRVSSWQQAALLRFMDWTDDKLVSDAEYRAALENLKHRRIGGGRR